MTQRIYLDYNATSPLHPTVRQAMVEAMDIFGNPSSIHRDGVLAKKGVERARMALAQTLGVKTGQIVFTSGGSEANTTVLGTFTQKTILCGATEHASVLNNPNISLTIPVTKNGVIDLKSLENLAAQHKPKLISIMAANNETGVIQPMADIANIAYNAGASLHCDMVQAFGKIPMDQMVPYCDFITLAFHKVGGPKGIGAIISRCAECLDPMIFGGAQEHRRRAGTENTVALAGMTALCEVIDFSLYQNLSMLHRNMENRLMDHGGIIVGQGEERLPNTTCVIMPDVAAETQLIHCDLSGISVSSGSACSSGKVAPSGVLTAMGYTEKEAACALRISSGHATTENDLQQLTQQWIALKTKTHQHKNAA